MQASQGCSACSGTWSCAGGGDKQRYTALNSVQSDLDVSYSMRTIGPHIGASHSSASWPLGWAQVVERLEAVLQLQRFTQLGGLQLERDVRLLTSTLGEVGGGSTAGVPVTALCCPVW